MKREASSLAQAIVDACESIDLVDAADDVLLGQPTMVIAPMDVVMVVHVGDDFAKVPKAPRLPSDLAVIDPVDDDEPHASPTSEIRPVFRGVPSADVLRFAPPARLRASRG